MKIFETKRLDINKMNEEDLDFFIELLSASEIIDPIPQAKWTKEEVLCKFKDWTNYPSDIKTTEQVIWGVYQKEKKELIGLCGLLTNEENQRKIAYRFRKKYWGIGYGTELTKGLINYCFNELGLKMLTADVNVKNIGSVKILEKFFKPVKEFYNENDKSTDRRYVIDKETISKHLFEPFK